MVSIIQKVKYIKAFVEYIMNLESGKEKATYREYLRLKRIFDNFCRNQLQQKISEIN